MEPLLKQVAQARWRLIVGQFLMALAWCWSAALVVAAVAIAVAKVFPIDLGRFWSFGWLGGALVVGCCAAAIWTWITRPAPVTAAIELDRRFGLKERVSSALALSPTELNSDAGQALVGDAVRQVQRVDVRQRFAVSPRPLYALPLAPALLAIGLTFMTDKVAPTTAQAGATSAAEAKQVQQSTEALARKLAERRKEAAERGLKDAGDLFQRIEDATKDLANKQGVDRKQALVKLNDLAKELESRREKLGGSDHLKQQLDQMKDNGAGPADKLAQDLKNGNFQKALDEIKKLQSKLADNKLDPEKQKELAQQLNSMRESLDKMAANQRQQEQSLQQQLDQAKQSGNTAQADKLQQQLDQMRQQSGQQSMLQQLAQKLGKCSKSMREGQADQASQSLSDLSRQLQEMKHQSDELTMLDQTLDQIADAKESMCRGKGDGKKDGAGEGDGLGPKNSQAKSGQSQGGNSEGDDLQNDEIANVDNARGGGKASGHRPEKATGVKFYDSQVSPKIGKGSAVVTGETEGPNIKGQVRAEIQAQVESARHESADPLIGQRIPRGQRDYAREYFDALRDGQ